MSSQVKIPAEKWAAYIKLGAEASAIEKARKALVAEFEAAGLPVAAENLNGQTVILCNGNGDEMGKASYFAFPGSVTPAGNRRRIS